MIFTSIFFTFALLLHPFRLVAAQENGDGKNQTCEPPAVKIPSTLLPTAHGPKVIIAHRGASAHLPEHSLQGYRLALELGADYIEPDLVATKDGNLIAMHSMDLNITTDVATKFPDRQTFSDYMNRSGYWSYEFTDDEIKSLRIRQRLPEARVTEFDGMFTIPFLDEILKLIVQWNTQIEPVRVNSTHVRAKRGVYGEIKDYPWLIEDTATDLVDLIFNHIDENEQLWEDAIMQNLCDYKRLKVHDYRLPPLVIQSFEGDAIKSFVNKWQDKYASAVDKPVPAMVLLVNHEDCLEDKFWFDVEEHWREFLSAIGPDKQCLSHRWREFMDRAIEAGLAVHPWTERPELEYTIDGPFESALEEMQYLFCTVGVHGVFSESVSTAVLASNLPCPDSSSPTSTPPQSDGSCDQVCYEFSKESNMYVGIGSFAIGFICSSIVFCLCLQKNHDKRNRRQIDTAEPVPIEEDELEMTADDREML